MPRSEFRSAKAGDHSTRRLQGASESKNPQTVYHRRRSHSPSAHTRPNNIFQIDSRRLKRLHVRTDIVDLLKNMGYRNQLFI